MTTVKEEFQKASQDMGNLVESTTQLIDMHFTQYAEFLEDKNVGTLKAYRVLLERNLDQADVIGKQLVENTITLLNKEERLKLGSVFGIVSKIVDRIGYIDFLLEKRKITE